MENDSLKVGFAVLGTKSFSENSFGLKVLVRIQEDLRNFIYKEIRKGNAPEISVFKNRFDRFPVVGAAKIAAQETLRLEKEAPDVERTITFNLPNEKDADLFESTFCGYVNHVHNELGKEPYTTVDIIIEIAKGVDWLSPKYSLNSLM